MSREIKFRVWSSNKPWGPAYFYPDTEDQQPGHVKYGDVLPPRAVRMKSTVPIVHGPGCYSSSLVVQITLDGKIVLSGYQTDVNFILEQYTGLKDKNGRDIYEGDIVRHYFPNDVSEPFDLVPSVRTVIYDSRKAMFCVDSGLRGWPHLDKWEVIGNIHENPELLTKTL